MIINSKNSSNVPEIPQGLIVAILNAIRPEKIICFGRRSSRKEAWSCFLTNSEEQISTIYDLLILTKPYEKRNRHELLDMMDRFNSPTIKVNAIIHNINTVNESLMSGSIFFTRVYNGGLLLYDNHATPLIAPVENNNFKETTAKTDGVWNKSFSLAQQFLKGASYFSSAGENSLAAFLLHQAMEHTCLAVTRVITGYRPNTHNLGRLITITENFAPFLATVFPQNTKEETELFRILSRAYSDTRYNEAFKVSSGEINVLIERVSVFQRHAEKLLGQKLLHTGKASFNMKKEFKL